MATTSQRKALEMADENVTNTKNNVQTSGAIYQTATDNYKNRLEQGYTPSEQTMSYLNASDRALSAASAMGNFSYDSKRTGDIERLLSDAENMKFNFNYSLTDDPAYQTMRDEYVHNGQMAALNAAGNMVGQTGGFGSTAASAASQQAYNESLTQLNGAVPDLYNAAYNRQWNEFTNERDTLQQLASAYQSLDQQEFEQALSVWSNNFNQYITIAEEYQRKYEYMDSAERAEYEAELDGLWNLLTSAQEQHISDMNAYTNSLINYSDTAMGIANYEETVRSNKASEAAANAALAEEKRQFDANLAYQKEKDDANNTTTFTGSTNTNNFMASYSLSRTKESNSYKASVYKKLKTNYENGTLSADEYAYLCNYYNM